MVLAGLNMVLAFTNYFQSLIALLMASLSKIALLTRYAKDKQHRKYLTKSTTTMKQVCTTG